MEQMQMNMPDIYDAALYLRLSKDDMEDGGAKSESNSIANQREFVVYRIRMVLFRFVAARN